MRWVVASARIQHAQQVGKCRDTADGRAGGGSAALLLESDGGRKAVDGIDLGHAHLMKEAARVWGDGFQVAALRFGIESAKGERRLARAGYAGEHNESISRDPNIHVLEIVFAGATDVDVPVVRFETRRIFNFWNSRRHALNMMQPDVGILGSSSRIRTETVLPVAGATAGRSEVRFPRQEVRA